MSEEFKERYQTTKDICLERRSVRKYIEKDLPEGVLEDILVATQSVPTSINSQPYKMMVVRTKEDKEKLGKTMMLGNERFINTSSATVMFLADLQPHKTAKEYGELQSAAGHSAEGVKMHVMALKWLTSSVPFFGTIFNWFYNFYGLFTKVVRRDTSTTFSAEQTYLAVQQFVLLCQSYGLGNIILGGYDGVRIRKAFNIPCRYQVVACVCVGYEDKTEVYKPSLRYKPESVIFEGKFGQPLTTPLIPLPGKQTWEAKTN